MRDADRGTRCEHLRVVSKAPERAVVRATRVATPPIEARLGAEFGRLVNVSATGALIRTPVPLTLGHEYPMTLNASQSPPRLVVRVVRAQPRPLNCLAPPPACPHLIAVRFTEPPRRRNTSSRHVWRGLLQHESPATGPR
jgi:hypothetical protein